MFIKVAVYTLLCGASRAQSNVVSGSDSDSGGGSGSGGTSCGSSSGDAGCSCGSGCGSNGGGGGGGSGSASASKSALVHAPMKERGERSGSGVSGDSSLGSNINLTLL
jgi:hypothetical protein